MAALIAFRNAARTPERSSSLIARVVVPPGEVTASRSSTGCIPSSRSKRALPNIVCTTSFVETSRRETEEKPGLDHRLGQQSEVRRPRAGESSYGIEVDLGDPHHPAEMPERLLCKRQIGLTGGAAGSDPRNPLVHERRRVRHGTHDPRLRREVPLDERGRHSGCDRKDHLLRGHVRRDLAEHGRDVLRLDGEHDERRARNGRHIVGADGDLVALAQLFDALGAANGDGELVRTTPVRAQEAAQKRLAETPGAEDGDPPGHRRSTNDAPWLCDGAWWAREPSTHARTSASRG